MHRVTTEELSPPPLAETGPGDKKDGTGGARPRPAPRRRRRWLRILVALAVVAGLGAAWGLNALARKDALHGRFFNTGKTINGFLTHYCGAVKQSIAAGSVAPVARFYSTRYASPGRGRWSWQPAAPINSVAVAQLVRNGTDDFGTAELESQLAEHLGEFATLEASTCKIDLIEGMEPEQSATLTVIVNLNGVDHDGRIFQDRQLLRWRLENEAPAASAGEGRGVDWRIVHDELVEGVRVAGDGRGFRSVDPQAIGIDFEHRRDPKLDMKKHAAELKFAVIQHASGGASAADWNSDGWPDLLFADGRRVTLYRHLGTGADGEPAFVDVTDEAGLGVIDSVNAGLFADIDNDGDKDLFLARYMAPSRLFLNNGDGTFTDRSAEMGLDFIAPSISPTFFDYDRDGYLDLYVGCTGNAFEELPRLPFFANNGGKNLLFHNDGGTGFTDVSDASGTADTGWSLAVAAADYDGDGWVDLAVANDFGRKCLFHNNGDGTFSELAKDAGVLDFSGGMGLAFGDFDDDGRIDLYTSNINSNQRWFGEDMTVGQYMRNVMRTRWALLDMSEFMDVYRLLGSEWKEVGQQIGEGNSLFRNNGDGTFEEQRDSHTQRAGWGWSVAFLDYDNDTDLDIYAANGWISNTPETDL